MLLYLQQLLFQKPPVILKIVLKVGHECTLKKSTNEIKGKQEQNLMLLSEQILELVSEASKTSY